MIKAVLDTNVLVSGLISSKGSPAKIIDFWEDEKFSLITSKKIMEEVVRVLSYPKIRVKYNLDKEKIKDFINGLTFFSEVCKPQEKISVINDDPEDNKFLEAAVQANAGFVVSGDKHLLGLGEYEKIRIIKPNTFLSLLKRKQNYYS